MAIMPAILEIFFALLLLNWKPIYSKLGGKYLGDL